MNEEENTPPTQRSDEIERLYRAHLSPLVKQIHEFCDEHKISYLACFQLSAENDARGNHYTYSVYMDGQASDRLRLADLLLDADSPATVHIIPSTQEAVPDWMSVFATKEKGTQDG